MKKKFSLWLNIVTICLCVCAIAIGVYSATTATLKVSGQIGFEAHGCEIVVEGTLSGYVTSADSKEIQNNQPLETVELNNDEKAMVISDESKPEETKYFTDLVDDSVTPITLKLDITNNSKFKVRANVTVPQELTDNNIAISANKTTFVIDANEGTGDVELTFTVINPNNDAQVTLSAVENLKIEFVKFDGYYDGEYFIDEDNKLTVYMGHGTEVDKATNVRLPWQAFAVKGSYDGTTATAPTGFGLTNDSYYIIVDNNTEETTDDEAWYSLAGINMTDLDYTNNTFWFIQKYVTAGGYDDAEGSDRILGTVFNESVYDGNNYADTSLETPVMSDIYTYVTGNYLTDIGVTTGTSKTYFDTIFERVVNEYTEARKPGETPESPYAFLTCSFTSRLWLISLSELELLVGAEMTDSYSIDLTRTYGIGNIAGWEDLGHCMGADWWLRSVDSNFYSDYKYVSCVIGSDYNCKLEDWDVDGGMMDVGWLWKNAGVRAAFQVEIK